jgi:hypothetical protein
MASSPTIIAMLDRKAHLTDVSIVIRAYNRAGKLHKALEALLGSSRPRQSID